MENEKMQTRKEKGVSGRVDTNKVIYFLLRFIFSILVLLDMCLIFIFLALGFILFPKPKPKPKPNRKIFPYRTT